MVKQEACPTVESAILWAVSELTGWTHLANVRGMTLREYLRQKRGNAKRLSESLGLGVGGPAYIHQLASGHRLPSLVTDRGRECIRRIAEETNGQVSVVELRPEETEFILEEIRRWRPEMLSSNSNSRSEAGF